MVTEHSAWTAAWSLLGYYRSPAVYSNDPDRGEEGGHSYHRDSDDDDDDGRGEQAFLW